MCQMQAVVHAHAHKGHNANCFYGPELILHDSEKEAKQRADFLDSRPQQRPTVYTGSLSCEFKHPAQLSAKREDR